MEDFIKALGYLRKKRPMVVLNLLRDEGPLRWKDLYDKAKSKNAYELPETFTSELSRLKKARLIMKEVKGPKEVEYSIHPEFENIFPLIKKAEALWQK